MKLLLICSSTLFMSLHLNGTPTEPNSYFEKLDDTIVALFPSNLKKLIVEVYSLMLDLC